MNKKDAIKAMLDGKIVVDDENVKWRYEEGKFEYYNKGLDRWLSIWTINEEDCDNWRIED